MHLLPFLKIASSLTFARESNRESSASGFWYSLDSMFSTTIVYSHTDAYLRVAKRIINNKHVFLFGCLEFYRKKLNLKKHSFGNKFG